jgi:hypothetical protein
MSYILDFFNTNKGDSNNVSLAQKYLVKDLLDSNLKGENKIFELDGIDIESSLNGKIIPSLIYTFIYDYKKDKNLLSFGDKFPMVFCLNLIMFERQNSKSINMRGINLNLMTQEEKVKFLDFIVSTNEKFYTEQIYKDNNKVHINNIIYSSLSNDNIIELLSNVVKFDISKYVRMYTISNCKNIRLIEYNLWKYIPFYKHTIEIKGLDKTILDNLILKLFKNK